MRRLANPMMSLTMLAGLWLVLSGSDQGCWVADPDCSTLDEAACLLRPDCRAIYSEEYWAEDGAGTRCMEYDGARCIVPEPVFERCEVRPTCGELDEQACLAESACQAVYGYDGILYGDATTRCMGARCIEPPQTFIECVEAGTDYCQGLAEEECYLRIGCEAEYDYPGCEDWGCWDGSPVYAGCHLAGAGQCRTDEDCYAVYGPAEDGVPSPDCYNWYMTCEAGQCVEHCEGPVGCQDDSWCAAGERCEIRCGNGWCEGVCVPVEEGCWSDADCPAGQTCVFMPCDCLEGDPDCLEGCVGAPGFCIPAEIPCVSNEECPEGYVCEMVPCEPGMTCGAGWCVPVQQDCQVTGCPEGQACEEICYEACPGCENGDCDPACLPGCVFQCVPVQQDCQFTGCPAGEVCEVMCLDWCDQTVPAPECCFGTCVPEQQRCLSDADCPAGYICQIDSWCEDGTWCGEGVCVPNTQDCQVIGCPAGFECQVVCPDCGPNVDCEAICYGECVPVQPTCFGDQDCPEGMYCAGDFCDPAYCGGICLPIEPQGCQSDAECAPGERCEVYCGNGWCQGQCVPAAEPTWLYYEPMQCVETPWGLDAAMQPEAYWQCMLDCGAGVDCGTGFEEICMVRTFFELQGVPVLDVRHVNYNVDVCEACGVCARGDVYYVLVDGVFVELVMRFGFLPY